MKRTRIVALLACSLLAWSMSAASTATYEQALELYNRTDYARALSLLRTLPETAQNLELTGRSQYLDGDPKRASESLEKAVAKAPADSMKWTWLARAYGRRAETAFAFAALGLANKTREAFEKAAQLDPGNLEALNDLFSYYLEAPGMVGGGHDKARKLLPAIEKLDPPEGASARARLAEAEKDYAAAERHFLEAAQRAPKQVGRLLDLAHFFRRRGRPDEGERTFQQAEKMAPDAPIVLYSRAEALIAAKRDLPRAQALLRQYLASQALTPDDPSRKEAQKLLAKAQGK